MAGLRDACVRTIFSGESWKYLVPNNFELKIYVIEPGADAAPVPVYRSGR